MYTLLYTVTLDLCAAMSTSVHASQPQSMLVCPSHASLPQCVLLFPSLCWSAPLADKAAAEKHNGSLQVDDNPMLAAPISFASKHSSLEARCAACGVHLIPLLHDLIQAWKPVVLLLGCIWLAVTWIDSGMQARCVAYAMHLIGCCLDCFRQSGSAAARSLTKPAMMWSGYGGRWTGLMWRSVTSSTRPLLSTRPCR